MVVSSEPHVDLGGKGKLNCEVVSSLSNSWNTFRPVVTATPVEIILKLVTHHSYLPPRNSTPCQHSPRHPTAYYSHIMYLNHHFSFILAPKLSLNLEQSSVLYGGSYSTKSVYDESFRIWMIHPQGLCVLHSPYLHLWWYSNTRFLTCNFQGW